MRRIIRLALTGMMALALSLAAGESLLAEGTASNRGSDPGQGAGAAEARVQDVVADSLFMAGRAALNRGEYSRAIELFRAVREGQPESPRVAEALYWESFALYRLGGRENLRRALTLLERRREEFPEATTASDARVLTGRIQGQLAMMGDAAAAAAIGEAAAAAAGGVVRSSTPSSSRPTPTIRSWPTTTDLQREIAAVQREIVGAQREAAAAQRELAAIQREMASAMWGAGWGADERLPDECSPEDVEISTVALNALLRANAERALPVLHQVLARRDICSTPLRRTAVFLVAQRSSPETAQLLVEVARTDPDLRVRRNAIFHLPQVDSEHSLALLEEVLRTPADSALHEHALYAIAQHDDESAHRALRTYAARTDIPTRLRGMAIYWVGRAASPEDQSFLSQLYRELPDDQLKGRLLMALAQVDDSSSTRWLLGVALDTTEAIQVRTSALYHAASRSSLPVEDLVALYDRLPDQELKRQVLLSLAQRKDDLAVDKLIEIARGDADLAQRKHAIYWLSQTGDPRAAEVLLELLAGTVSPGARP